MCTGTSISILSIHRTVAKSPHQTVVLPSSYTLHRIIGERAFTFSHVKLVFHSGADPAYIYVSEYMS